MLSTHLWGALHAFIFPPAFALIRDRTYERRGAFLPGLAGYVGMLFPIAQVCFYVSSLMFFSQHKLSVSVDFCLSLNFPRGQPSARVYHKLGVRVHVERPWTPGVILTPSSNSPDTGSHPALPFPGLQRRSLHLISSQQAFLITCQGLTTQKMSKAAALPPRASPCC